MLSPRSPRRCGDAAFTLIELLVVIVIIGILAGVSFPIYNLVITKSRQTTTLSNLRQVGAAFLLYAGDNNNQLPGRITTTNKWPTLMSTYVQNYNVYNAPVPGYVGTQYQTTNPTLLLSNTQNYTNYIANGYNDLGTYTNENLAPRLNLIATPSQVILLGIKLPSYNGAVVPDFYMDLQENNQVNALDTKAWTNGSVYTFCDGSASFLMYPPAGTSMTIAPTNSAYYSDWLWYMIKTNATN